MTLSISLIIIAIIMIAVMTLKSKSRRFLIAGLSFIALILAGGLFLLYNFLSALGPPDVTITRNQISTNRDFINGVTIEKINVDSIGNQGYPVRYTTVYTTSCNILHPANKPPAPPNKIEFNKPGKYFWDEDTIKVRFINEGLSRKPLDPISKIWWLNKFGKHPVCPIKLYKEQWYFITIGDPQLTGIFFYIDKENQEHQYYIESGVSPI